MTSTLATLLIVPTISHKTTLGIRVTSIMIIVLILRPPQSYSNLFPLYQFSPPPQQLRIFLSTRLSSFFKSQSRHKPCPPRLLHHPPSRLAAFLASQSSVYGRPPVPPDPTVCPGPRPASSPGAGGYRGRCLDRRLRARQLPLPSRPFAVPPAATRARKRAEAYLVPRADSPRGCTRCWAARATWLQPLGGGGALWLGPRAEDRRDAQRLGARR